MDGNLKAEHLPDWRLGDQVWLMDGLGYMVGRENYKAYLKATHHPLKVCFVSTRSTADVWLTILHLLEVDMQQPSGCQPGEHRTRETWGYQHQSHSLHLAWMLCSPHHCRFPKRRKVKADACPNRFKLLMDTLHRQVNMDYSLAHALGHNMDGITDVITFYDINCSYMKKLWGCMVKNDYITELNIIPRIGIWHGHRPECSARYALLFISGVGWVDSKVLETLWSLLNIVSGSTQGMTSSHCQELLDFQMNNSNFMKMIRMSEFISIAASNCKFLLPFAAHSLSRKLKGAQIASVSAIQTFNDLDHTVSDTERQNWIQQAADTHCLRASDPSAMDIYDLWLPKSILHFSTQGCCCGWHGTLGRSVHAMTLDLLQCPPTSADRQTGAPTWLSRGLKIQEAQIILARDMQCVGLHATEIQHLAIARWADRLSTDISGFLSECKIHLGTTSEDKMPLDDSEVESDGNAGDADEDLLHRFEGRCPDRAHIPLPSTLGWKNCNEWELNHLMEMELQLRIGQADEVLQEIWVGVADKAIIYCGDLQPVTGYAKKTRGWAKVHAVQHVLDKHALVYRKCWEAMVRLSADKATLAHYQILWKEQLNVNTSAINPNSRGLQYEVLPWYFNLDIKSEQTSSAWMSECRWYTFSSLIFCQLNCTYIVIRVHWLQAKAIKNWWLEEEELLKCEFEWSISCFQHCMKRWKNCRIESWQIEFTSAACYAARQEATYGQLGEQCRVSLE